MSLEQMSDMCAKTGASVIQARFDDCGKYDGKTVLHVCVMADKKTVGEIQKFLKKY
jgi:hypothetical protein